MEFGDLSIPDACFYGCPEVDFDALRQAITEHEQDLTTAQAAGLSNAALEAIAGLSCGLREQISKAIDKIPEDAPHPWRPKAEGLPSRAASALSSIECCRIGGIVLLGKEGTYRVKR